jgi:hypothetical protein
MTIWAGKDMTIWAGKDSECQPTYILFNKLGHSPLILFSIIFISSCVLRILLKVSLCLGTTPRRCMEGAEVHM